MLLSSAVAMTTPGRLLVVRVRRFGGPNTNAPADTSAEATQTTRDTSEPGTGDFRPSPAITNAPTRRNDPHGTNCGREYPAVFRRGSRPRKRAPTAAGRRSRTAAPSRSEERRV